jgi:hypothetical protein
MLSLAFVLVTILYSKGMEVKLMLFETRKNETYKNMGKENFTLILQGKRVSKRKMPEQSFKP